MKENQKVERTFQKVCEKYDIENRAFTKEDFYRICESENITAKEMDSPTSFYLRVKSKLFIVVEEKLEREKKIFAMMHELGHHFLEHRGRKMQNAFYFDSRDKENEAEADGFALLATGLKQEAR